MKRGAEHFAHADLPSALLGGEGGQAEQPQAGDQNGEADNVDKGLFFVFAQIAQHDFEVVFEHDFLSGDSD
jgi:hypothetical protein